MLARRLWLVLFSGSAFAASTFPALTYSTFLRDSFTPKAIATDPSGNIYIAGNAIVDPATRQNAVLVLKLNPQATQYLYVRYLGGSVNDSANAIAVDAAGDAYIAGSTASPDFPNTGDLGTPPTGADQQSFVAKLDPDGVLAFSDLLGGSAASVAQAVAVNAAGQILVSGTIGSSGGFPTTSGAYSIGSAAIHPYLLEIDPNGKSLLFSATGIGGSALALDSAGNIYIAGTTHLLDYPTTTGSYQPTFPAFRFCFSPSCMTLFQGANQYVTKVDPTGAKLIYSTALSGTGDTTNAGLAVDAAGDVYVTGFAGATYPYTATVPPLPQGEPFVISALPFLSKLDPTGQKLLFSVPVGGTGVRVDPNGAVYVGGGVGSFPVSSYAVAADIPALANVPKPCLPNITAQPVASVANAAYVAQVDPGSGDILGSQFIGGSSLELSGIAVSGSTVWTAGVSQALDFPLTPDALIPAIIDPSQRMNAYLGAVDFSQPQPPPGTPRVGCIVDAADLAPAGLVARNQILTIFGTGLGPDTGISATDYSTSALGGVTVSFGADPAPLLYASSTQINFAVPLVLFNQSSPTMQLAVNAVAAPPRQVLLTFANPSLFIDVPASFPASGLSPGYVAVALNADGSLNSATNPARLGSAISVFVNGLTPDPQVTSAPLHLYTDGGWSVTDIAQENPFVLRVGLQVPSALVNNFSCPPPSSVCAAGFSLFDIDFISTGAQSQSTSGDAFGGVVYITQQ